MMNQKEISMLQGLFVGANLEHAQINVVVQSGAKVVYKEVKETERPPAVVTEAQVTEAQVAEAQVVDAQVVEEVETEECGLHNDKNLSTGTILLSCIETLMNEKDEEGNSLVSKANHWMAIFRIIVDKNLGVSNTDYLGFCKMINQLKPEGFRVALKYDTLKRISESSYTKPFEKWAYDSAYNPTRKPYDEMVKIATRFQEILEENGR